MQWSEVEQRAKEYEASFPEGMVESDFRFSCSSNGRLLHLVRETASHHDLSSLQRDMARLQVEDVLYMLLREKWGHGTVFPLFKTSSSPMVGFHLVSSPYPTLEVIGNKSPSIGLTEEDTSLTRTYANFKITF